MRNARVMAQRLVAEAADPIAENIREIEKCLEYLKGSNRYDLNSLDTNIHNLIQAAKDIMRTIQKDPSRVALDDEMLAEIKMWQKLREWADHIEGTVSINENPPAEVFKGMSQYDIDRTLRNLRDLHKRYGHEYWDGDEVADAKDRVFNNVFHVDFTFLDDDPEVTAFFDSLH